MTHVQTTGLDPAHLNDTDTVGAVRTEQAVDSRTATTQCGDATRTPSDVDSADPSLQKEVSGPAQYGTAGGETDHSALQQVDTVGHHNMAESVHATATTTIPNIPSENAPADTSDIHGTNNTDAVRVREGLSTGTEQEAGGSDTGDTPQGHTPTTTVTGDNLSDPGHGKTTVESRKCPPRPGEDQQTAAPSLDGVKEDPAEEDPVEEDGRAYSTEDEASDWEGPVDVELEMSPASVQQPSKASWSTVKALARWMPLGRTKHPWTQMAGHQGSFLAGPDGCILKVLVPGEEKNLKQLMTEAGLKQYVPQYHGTVDKDGASYIQLQDLLCEFSSPCVMDIKMGVRTYLEEELHKARKKPTLRKDLYQKMVSIDPEAPTQEEQEQEAILKPRYMKFRDDMSSTSTLGFRIEGIKTRSGASKDYKNTRSPEEVKEALSAFVEDNTAALDKYTSLLSDVCKAQESSTFFESHEMVGSSLLFVHDHSGKAGVWMIDFAKCSSLPSTVSVDHRSPWIPGNYEDGYLFGLDNLTSIFQTMATSRQSKE